MNKTQNPFNNQKTNSKQTMFLIIKNKNNTTVKEGLIKKYICPQFHSTIYEERKFTNNLETERKGAQK